jgi:hypothetical protein
MTINCSVCEDCGDRSDKTVIYAINGMLRHKLFVGF